MKDSGNEQFADSPIVVKSDASFQDCPDTLRSTGGYLIFMQGAVVDSYSGSIGPICHSTCEAEYCIFSSALMAASYFRKLHNEFHGFDSDRPLTIPLGTDSQSAMDTAKSSRETSRTRHIARRYHYVRMSIAIGSAVLFKIEGTRNCANSLTKALPAALLEPEAAIYQVDVDP